MYALVLMGRGGNAMKRCKDVVVVKKVCRGNGLYGGKTDGEMKKALLSRRATK